MGSTHDLPPHLLSDREIHVVVSILSGLENAQSYHDKTLKPFLDSHKLKYSTHVTKSAQTIEELTENLFLFNACKGVKQTIILLSGDGGVVDVVNTLATILYRTNDDSRRPSIFVKPVIALIPQGTANALAWSSGVASDPLNTLMKGRAHGLPMFQVTFSPGARLVTNEGTDREVIESHSKNPKIYGVVVFSWGLHASLVARCDTREYRKHGVQRFKMAFGELLEGNHIYNGLIKVRSESGQWEPLHNDGSWEDRDHAYILASLVSNLEEHFKISPATQPLDGKLRVVGIRHLPRDEIRRVGTLPYQNGKHVEDPMVTYKEIEAMQIDFLEDDEQWRQVCIDGKIVAVEQGGWVEVIRLPGSGVDGRRVVELVR